MSRRAWVACWLALSCLAGWLWLFPPGFVLAGRPNFVVIIADDLGAGDLGTYGHPVIKTPNMDTLAQQGLQFNQAFLTTSSCTASRASILTGRYPQTTGAPRLDDAVPAAQVLLTQRLRDRGYYTASIGKWHLGALVKKQFDRVLEPSGNSGAEDWVSALQQRPKNKPFFFWLASKDPHWPFDDLRPDGPYQPQDVVLPPTVYDGPGARQNIAQYYTEVSRLDAAVGKVMAELQRQGVLDNTHIILLSDNGVSLPHAKTTLYDAGIRTPLLWRGPSVPAGKHSEALVSTVDLAPTLLALAGIAPPATMQGKPFVALLRDPAVPYREAIYAEQHDHGFPLNKRAVRTQDYLYIRNIGINKSKCLLELQPMEKELFQAYAQHRLNEAQSLCLGAPAPEEEFYDVHGDPYQLRNLVGDPGYRQQRQILRELLDEQAKAVQDSSYF